MKPFHGEWVRERGSGRVAAFGIHFAPLQRSGTADRMTRATRNCIQVMLRATFFHNLYQQIKTMPQTIPLLLFVESVLLTSQVIVHPAVSKSFAK